MSCHFDSSIDSPGAGDNAISCAIMIEIIRVLSQSATPIQHSMVFLFNGAEENLLQASHGFITKHPWVDSIKAFVNIDSAGNGGWEVVFQTGPLHPWLTRAYAESAPYPSGSILGQELFQSGIIPSDTDYRIYRDFGDIPGLDIAYITNGYVYHTQNDQNRFIHQGCLQRGGENLLAVLWELSKSSHLADPGPEKDGTMIFFDLVGYVMIYYPQRVAVVINSALMAAILFRIIRKTFNIDRSDNHDVKYFQNLLKAMFFMALTYILVILTTVAMALLVTLCGRNMSWFTHNYNLIPLFLIPPCITVLMMHEALKGSLFKNNISWYNEQIFFEANMTIWSILMLMLTLKGIGSAFFPMLYVLGPLFIRDRTLWIFKNRNWKRHPYRFFCLHLLGLFIPSLITIYVGNAVAILFLPILGRTGTEVNSDVAIGVICSFFLVLLSGYLVSLIYLCGNMKKVISFLSAISAVWLLAIVFTPLGFPYSGNQQQPSPMRLLALHARRRAHDIQGTMTYEDSGIWLIPFDYNNNRQLIAAMPRLQEAEKVQCHLGPYCGVPFIIPVIDMLHPKNSLYMAVNKHDRPDVICKKVQSEKDEIGLTKLTFEVTGPDHITLQVRPHHGVSLQKWSVSEYRPYPAAMPPDVNETTYFVYYSHGETPATPWTFSLHFKVPVNHDTSKGIVDIGLAGHYLHSDDKHTTELDAFLAQTPDWTTPVTWSASWDGFVF
ncbi:endoplasmic reticulum metallopeptidase 1-like [Ruditapes philippinarum]|uniref:endoplasmic reticulum metallopeptidase 1-like n=1 Tax=Ruditapes philippinarum TaxID=129788 RepID=UPI00295C2F0E|nr:endoplasmic reticulum metallopeptidase 1-like [Ruditapes philippinarum]